MAIKDDREYRNLGNIEIRQAEGAEPSFFVEGYASTFEPYKLLTIDGVDYYERIDPQAFENADMSDVVFLRDHEGRVLARTKNGSIELHIDDKGLWTRTDLGLTSAAREMFEDIQSRNYSQMSFSFTVDKDEWSDLDTDHPIRHIRSIHKIFEVSAVTWPAYEKTSLQARSKAEALESTAATLESARAEKAKEERRAKIEELKALLEEIKGE